MLFFIPVLCWFITAFIVLDFLGANRVRKKAQQFAKMLYEDGPCTRIRVKGYLADKKGQKIPLEGKIYVNQKTRKYIFYADLTYQLLYAEKWFFTHKCRYLYKLSNFRKLVTGPFEPDFFPDLFSGKGEIARNKYHNDREKGGVINWRELENEIIPRWINHSFLPLGEINLEIIFLANESDFHWW